MTKRQQLILVDGSSYLYRAFHVLESLTTSRGEPTGAMYGVVNMLRKLLNDYHPDYFAVVFDPKGKTFRDELYSEYKAQRPPMPNELQAQIEPLHAMIHALGLPLLVVDGFEADDVIATLSRLAVEAGLEVVISTGDKDMAQLVDQQVTLVNTMNDTTMDRHAVIAKFGVAPEQIVDYLALVGDTSDNVPGIPGVGPKTAAKWLQSYGNLDAIVQRSNEISGKVGENLRSHQQDLPRNRLLVTVKSDVPVGIPVGDLKPQPRDTVRLLELYRRWEFSGWLKELQATGVQTRPDVARKYELILTEPAFDAWMEKLRAAALFSFDTETTSLDYMLAELVGVSFCVEPHHAAYVPLAHRYLDAPAQLNREAVLQRLRPLLEDPNRAKLGHNLKYDMSVLARHGVKLRGVAHDTMLESYCYNSTASKHNLDDLALKYLGYKTIHFEDIAGSGPKQKRFDDVAVEQAGEYAAEDADVAMQLHQKIFPLLESKTRALYESIEIPLIPVLSRIERNGVLIDTARLAEQSRELTQRIAELERRAEELAGEKFNLSSPKQLQSILFDKLKLPVQRKTPKGQPSTDESVLENLAWDYPLPKIIMEHRTLQKLKSTYVDRLPEQVNPQTGRVHTSYHQAVAATGRLSSADPNLQNIPIRTPEGRRVRQAFIAPEGYVVMSADYSQIELRIMAHLSQDANLCQAFSRGEDVHRATAAEIFGCSEREVDSNQRRSAKAINFGLIYGMSAFGLARQLGIERNAAQSYIDRYFERYPAVRQFMDDTREQARRLEYVETLFGRRLHVPEIRTRNFQRRQYAERTAINAPMQGTAADIIKRAMIMVQNHLDQADAPCRMIMQVHDELVFEVRACEAEHYSRVIAESMSQAAQLTVPLLVDVHSGANWDEAH